MLTVMGYPVEAGISPEEIKEVFEKFQKSKILVVHRDETITGLFKVILEKEGYQVDAVSSYSNGLEGKYALVFVQGSEILLRGSEWIEKSKVPVIMISGGESEFYYKLSREVGCRWFISLPRENLVEKLRELVRELS